MNASSFLGAFAITLVSISTQAATFEGAGAVQRVMLENSLIEVNDAVYTLPTQVNARDGSGGPVISQLRPGTVVGFSGRDLGLQYPLIDSLVIHRQPTPEEEAELASEQPNE